jgi:hypothetical protein
MSDKKGCYSSVIVLYKRCYSVYQAVGALVNIRVTVIWGATVIKLESKGYGVRESRLWCARVTVMV